MRQNDKAVESDEKSEKNDDCVCVVLTRDLRWVELAKGTGLTGVLRLLRWNICG